MKREFIFYALLSVTLLVGTSCNRDSEHGDERTALQVIGGIPTRVYNNTWEADDAIGIYMLNEATPEEANKKYVTATDGMNGTFAPAANQTIYFPVDGSTRNFVAYYPYATIGADHLYAVNVATQTSQKAIDLLGAAKVTGKSKTDPKVAFIFAHKLAKIEIILQGDGASITNEQLAGTVVKITNQQTAATYNVLTGDEVSVIPGTPTEITLLVNGLKAEGIVLPNDDIADMELTFAVPAPINQTFDWAIKEAEKSPKFEAGKKYLYTITIAKVGLNVTSTVVNWEPGNGEGGEAGEAN